MKSPFLIKISGPLLAIITATAAYAAPGFDIAGIKFGMTSSQVEDAIRNIGSGHKIVEKTKWLNDTGDVPATISYCAIVKRDPFQSQQCDDEIIVGFGEDTRTAYYIYRRVTTQGTASQLEVKNGLIEKYNIDPKFFRDYFVRFTTDGLGNNTPIPPNSCPESGGSNGPPAATSDGCRISVQVVAVESTVRGINERYAVFATHHPLMLSNLKAMKAKQQAASSVQQQQMLSNTKKQKF